LLFDPLHSSMQSARPREPSSPRIFGVLTQSGSRGELLGGYALGARLVIAAALVA
jgi:hypothetical protein